MSDWGKGVINNIGWGQGADNDIGWGSIYDKSNAGETLLKSDLNIDDFIIEVKTDNTGTSNNNQFQFTGAEGDYDVVAKQNDIVVATFNDLSDEETITFANGAGTYILEVKAKEVDGFTGMRFNNSGDKEKITKNLQWGIFNDTRQSLFYGCSNLTEIGNDVNWLNSITNGYQMFRDCRLTSLPETLILNNVINGDFMFFGCLFTSLPSGMTLNNLNSGERMLQGGSLTSLPSGMTLPNLSNGQFMFESNNLTSLPSGMTLPNLTDGDFMFISNNLTSLPSGMTLPNLSNGKYMFESNNLTSLPSGMTLPNLTDGQFMFESNNLTSLPSGMTLPNLTDGQFMFESNTINTARYSTLLVDMEDLNSNANVSFGGGNSKYNADGETAKNLLITNQNWTFTDGGPA
jgi:hypothetical protein